MVAEDRKAGERGIWLVLIAILLIFTAIIFYTRRVSVSRVEEQSKVPVVAHYTNYAYQVNLRYPPEWTPVGGQQYDRYEGADGFFSISAGGTASSSIEDLVKNETDHPLKPYGKTPAVLKLTIDGQDARLIMPSPDQDASMHGQAVLLVRYPTLVVIGSQAYRYFVFWADRAHIQDLASSINFLNKIQ